MREITTGALRLAMQITGSKEDALDILQTAILKSLEHRNAPGPQDARFKPWFYKVVHNQAIDWLRARQKFRDADEDAAERLPATDSNPEQQLIQEQRRLLLHKALGQLTSEQREIICLKDFHDFSYNEIAQIMDLDKGTVMSRLHRARMALKERLLALNVIDGETHE